MISLSYLNKLLKLSFFIIFLTYGITSSFAAVDIWEKNENDNEEINSEKEKKIKSPILSDEINKIEINISEEKIKDSSKSVIGIFDPEDNNFNLDMWSASSGKEIKEVLKRIEKIKLSKAAEDLLFQVIFTNAYAPKANLSSEEFLDIKIKWLIQRKRINDLETLLKNNPEVGKNITAVKFLINEYISSTDIKSACEKINFIDRKVQNNYLDKFIIYCLINNDRNEEAQLVFDLLKERGFKDNFFENKVNFLLGVTDKTEQKILDNNLFNFYLSYITSENFDYQPSEKTDKYIWRFLSSSNLIKINDFEDESIILTYEQAASQNAFDNDEIFKIYLKMSFNFQQLINAQENYRNLPNYKSRALIYQSILLSDNVANKIDLALLLKELFIKDEILNVYSEELSNILKSISPNEIPENYLEVVKENLDNPTIEKIKFDNSILHRSKVIRHFLERKKKVTRTEKDFKVTYKKIKKNRKYFVSIKDIIVLESLVADGISIPSDLEYETLRSQLTVPKNLEDLVSQNQVGLVMLKIVEIIGEDNIRNLDPETVYFLNKILNDLNLKKIRDNILSEFLPQRV